MLRRARKKSSTGVYHIVLRGINKQLIFLDNEDNEKFLSILDDCKIISEFDLYGYCLMGNHIHILLKEGKESLEQVFKRIGTRYAYYFNKKYARYGHLFQDRYISEAVENNQYFEVVLRYIHQNPVKAGLCASISDYAWSSFANYLNNSGFVDTEFALGLIGESDFFVFMSEIKDCSCLENNEQRKRLTDDELISAIEDKLKIKAIMIQNEPRDVVKDILRNALDIEGVSTRQLSRVTGISINTIWTL